ncbi:hypothetical protein [Spirosoma sp. KUDC1026]
MNPTVVWSILVNRLPILRIEVAKLLERLQADR